NQDLARRAVTLRDGDGSFRSIEDFRYRLGLSLETMIEISPIVSTVRTAAARPGGTAGGRVVDSSSASNTETNVATKPSGRIVDF
ncbi:MAG: hypothetical protein ACKVQK_16590, partial [Burkholderiales bacterium]